MIKLRNIVLENKKPRAIDLQPYLKIDKENKVHY